MLYIRVIETSSHFVLGQTPLEYRLMEIKDAVSKGAKEIDIVLSRALVLSGDWEAIYNEVKAAHSACGDAHLKTILGTGKIWFPFVFIVIVILFL